MDLVDIGIILFAVYVVSNIVYSLFSIRHIHQLSSDPFDLPSYDKEYRHLSTTIEYLDELEKRIKEFRDAPAKICNTQCTKRQDFLKELYGQMAGLFSSIQAVHLVQLKKALAKLEQRYKKRFKRMHIEVQLRKWEENPPDFI